MDIAALRLFATVGQLNSFSKAAVILGVAQPTVSRVIGDLERHFGGPLFYRTGRGVTLTDLGAIALPRAQALVREAEQLTEDVRSFQGSPSGMVVLGALPSTVAPLLAELHMELRERLPDVRLRVYEAFSHQVERWLAEGEIDIGLLSRYRVSSIGANEPLLTTSLVLVRCPDAPPLPAQVEFPEAARLPLVIAAKPNGLRVLVEGTARRTGIPLNVVLEADSLNAQKDLVRRCGYYTIVAPQAVTEECRAGSLVASVIVKPSLTRRIVLASSQQHPLSRAAKAVLKVTSAVARRTLDAAPEFEEVEPWPDAIPRRPDSDVK